MSKSTRSALSDGGLTLMQLDASSYPLPDGSLDRIFVHDKYLLISGAYRDNNTVIRNQKIIQTGSQNLTQVGLHHNDDQVVQLRQTATAAASSTALYNSYATNWQNLVAVIHAG
jgi:phosphatidylserine/phosphatidylglycerophosphate/cardiolipin synthase-like enzyme